MEGSKGEACCLIRYAGGAHDTNKVDRIMLKFRPIAPKPVNTSGSISGGGVTTPENSEPSLKATGRKRRRQTKNNVKKRCLNKKRKTSPEETTSGVKTLSFLPETPDHATPRVSHVTEGPTVVRRRVAVVVESVTDAWGSDLYLNNKVWGRTDEEKVMSLDKDTCPGFVTDGSNAVRWGNGAYRRMVAGDGGVVVVEGVALPACATAFTCVVRVVTCGEKRNCATLFCDVWRLECGGFAWRMDTKVALSLGIGN